MDQDNFQLRKASIKDISAITILYKDTVRTVNARDYTPRQIEVWAEGGENKERWEAAITDQYFVLVERKSNISGLTLAGYTLAGFASIAKDGYLDFMYVSKDYQRMGVASMLLNEIEKMGREQNNKEIYSHVSKTAKGFFLKRGYKHIKDIEDPYCGEIFINALMIKRLN